MAAHLFAIGNSVQLVANWLFSGFTPIGKQGYQDYCLSPFLHQLCCYLWRISELSVPGLQVFGWTLK